MSHPQKSVGINGHSIRHSIFHGNLYCSTDKIEVPVPNVASCTFGGKERNRLFITTAVDGLSEAEIQAYPLSGSLFVADVPGVVSGENHYPFIIR